MSENNNNPSKNQKLRSPSPTMLKLGELAERLRKVLKIKEAINSGSYKVPNEKVAEAIIKSETRL